MCSLFLLYRCNRSKEKKGIIQETNIPPLTKWSEQSSITFVKCWDDSLPFYAGNFKPGCNFDLFLGWFCWRRTSSNVCCLMQSVNLIISGGIIIYLVRILSVSSRRKVTCVTCCELVCHYVCFNCIWQCERRWRLQETNQRINEPEAAFMKHVWHHFEVCLRPETSTVPYLDRNWWPLFLELGSVPSETVAAALSPHIGVTGKRWAIL